MGKFMQQAANRDYSKYWQDPKTFPAIFQVKKPPITGRPISVLDNYLRCVKGEHPLWMPVYGWESDIIWPDTIEEHPVPEKNGYDWWGTEWQEGGEIGGMCVSSGTRVISDFCAWKEELEWPDLSLVDFAADGRKLSANFDPDRPHLYECVEGLFERLHEIIPFEEALLAFYAEPELLEEFFEKMADYKIECCRKIIENYGRVDGVLYHDDWGTQLSGFFSAKMFKEQIMPQTSRILDYIKKQGKFIELHSCGRNVDYVPYFIEMGVDMWTPQPGINDKDDLFEKYNDKITFGFDVPINTEMSEKEIVASIHEFVERYGANGRVMAWFVPDSIKPELLPMAREELYHYSREYYERLYK